MRRALTFATDLSPPTRLFAQLAKHLGPLLAVVESLEDVILGLGTTVLPKSFQAPSAHDQCKFYSKCLLLLWAKGSLRAFRELSSRCPCWRRQSVAWQDRKGCKSQRHNMDSVEGSRT